MQTVVCMHIYRLHNIHVNLQPSPLSILLQYCNILFWPIWLTHQISNLDLTFLPFVLIGLEQAFHLCNTSQLGSVAARDKIFWRVPIQTFYVTQTIFSSDQFRFWSFWYHGVILVKRNPHPRVDVEICAKFGGGWSSGLHMKEGHRYIQTVCFIFIDKVQGSPLGNLTPKEFLLKSLTTFFWKIL